VQTNQDYETIVVSSDYRIRDLVSKYDVKFIVAPGKQTLARRIIAHKNSQSSYALLLESSRFLEKDCLEVLSKRLGDMVIVEEHDIDKNIIAKIQNIERHGFFDVIKHFSPEFLIAEPRYIKKEVLDQALLQIERLDQFLVNQIQYGDLDIIYYESYRITHNLDVIRKPLIFHDSDANLLDLIKKYLSYGASNSIIRKTPYKSIFKLSNHWRPHFGFLDTALVYSLTSIKAVAFLVGSSFT
jgi:hypothetical protein